MALELATGLEYRVGVHLFTTAVVLESTLDFLRATLIYGSSNNASTTANHASSPTRDNEIQRLVEDRTSVFKKKNKLFLF